MRPNASDRFVLAALAVLAASSLGLKAAAGTPRDGFMDISADRVDQQLSSRLEAQHFSVWVQRFAHHSSMISGVRGNCRLGVRDARAGAAMETLFAREAASLGPVRYLYRGSSYDGPPSFAMRIGRLETEALSRLNLALKEPVPVAFAASPGCGASDFGFADVRV
jgi:hypothetical protein